MLPLVTPDPDAVAACWARFRTATGVTGEPADVFAFGDSPAMADALADLVVRGPKRATAGPAADHAEDGRLPEAGDHAVVVRGDGTPAAVLRTTEVRVGPLSSVDDTFARDEGEGDRTRDSWVAAHQAFVRRWCAATGRAVEDDPELVFERFAVVWLEPGGAGPDEVRTDRLRLRRWSEDDRPAFAAMNADRAVMEHLPGVLDRAGSDALLDRLEAVWDERGVGLWAVERRDDGAFLGWAGLNPMPPGTPGAGEWEIGWRFVREAWGHGYATEAAREGLRVARARGEARVWSTTVPANVRSTGVMRRLGLELHSRFDHPRFAEGHRLRAHVAYAVDLQAQPGHHS